MTDPWYEAEDSLSIQELAELVGIEDNEDWDDEPEIAEDAHLEAAYEDRFAFEDYHQDDRGGY